MLRRSVIFVFFRTERSQVELAGGTVPDAGACVPKAGCRGIPERNHCGSAEPAVLK